MQPDLFSVLTPECASCQNLGAPIESGIRYCWGALTWRWPHDRVEGCGYRGRTIQRHEPMHSEAEAITDLLESPRHQISAKDRKWLQAELRQARAAA